MSKPGRPNLSLAGKREAPTAAKPARGASTSSRGQRGRGGRGRGGGPRQKQELIQTGGVFSEGLGGDFPSRKKNADVDAGQFSYSKRDKPSATSSDEKPVKSPISGEGKASFKGWDALWCSDEEGDEAEMRALRPQGFISDLRRGTVMPVVLPYEDEPQFKNVLNKSARLSLEEDDGLIEQKDLVEQKEKTEMTAEQLVQMLEASTSDLLHLQLPSVVATLCNHNIRPPSPIAMETDEAPPLTDSAPSAPPTSLPESQKIGKLQVTRKGKLRLQIGGHFIDISAKKQTGKQQGTVLMEVEPSTDSVLISEEYQNQRLAKKFENQLYHLGMVKHNLVGSMEWRALNEPKGAEPEPEVIMEDVGGDKEAELRVEQLHKEQEGWAAFAEKWARGVI